MEAAPAGNSVALDRPEPRAHSLRRAAYLTAGVGSVHALLFVLSYWLLLGTPDATASATMRGEIIQRRVTLAGLYLMPFAGIAFIWFIVALRMWISGHQRPENVLLSNVQLVSGILYVALFFAAGGSAATAAASVEFAHATIDPVVAVQFPRYALTLLFVFAVRMAAMFVFTTSNIGRTTGVLPRWFSLAGLVVGLFMLLSATFSRVLVLIFPVWVLVLCAMLFNRARRIPIDASLPLPGARPAVTPLGGGGIES